jgi:hypothetical protein
MRDVSLERIATPRAINMMESAVVPAVPPTQSPTLAQDAPVRQRPRRGPSRAACPTCQRLGMAKDKARPPAPA